jgi:branched-chain amino acid transport system permease protein
LFPIVVVGAQLAMRATGTEYCLTQLTMAVYYAMVVMGLCLLMGYAGQVSLGHGAFFAIGGYTAAVLTTHDLSALKDAAWAGWLRHAHVLVARQDLYGEAALTVTPWAAFGAAMVATFLIALLIGWPALRLRGHYLAMATLGFGLIVSKIFLGSAITGAADGINAVPQWKLVPGLTVSGETALRVQNYYIACGLALLLLVFLRNLVHSRVGRALQAIHDGETAANAMGINTAACKLKVFVLSALLAAMAGVFFTHYTGGIGPSEAGALKSVRYVALAAVGGMANLWGVTLMSIALNYCSLRGWFGSYDHAVFGALLILIISLAPEGPLKPLALWLKRLMTGEANGESRRWFAQHSPFPLTPALSQRERENPRHSLDNSEAAGISTRGGPCLPLPKGEGRGEGEWGTRRSPSSDAPTPSFHHPSSPPSPTPSGSLRHPGSANAPGAPPQTGATAESSPDHGTP